MEIENIHRLEVFSKASNTTFKTQMRPKLFDAHEFYTRVERLWTQMDLKVVYFVNFF